MHKILYALELNSLRFLAKCIHAFGRRAVYAVADTLANLTWHLRKNRQALAIKNIQTHLEPDLEKAAHIAKESFSQNFRSFADIAFVQDFGFHLADKGQLELPDSDIWERFLHCTRPIIATTAHIGAWEFLSALIGDVFKAPRTRMIVVRQYNNPAVHQFIQETRSSARGLEVIGHRTAAPTVLKALKQNGAVGFLVDHKPKRSEAIMLPFLGEETAVNIGPALLGIRAEAMIWPTFILRSNNNIFKLHIDEPLDTKELTGTRQEKTHAAALFYTKAVEKQIIAHPEQWFWMHNRWDTPQ